jgi:hypothetical protein
MSGNLKGKKEYEQKAAAHRRVFEIQTYSLTKQPSDDKLACGKLIKGSLHHRVWNSHRMPDPRATKLRSQRDINVWRIREDERFMAGSHHFPGGFI